jgi:hypothetical protein
MKTSSFSMVVWCLLSLSVSLFNWGKGSSNFLRVCSIQVQSMTINGVLILLRTFIELKNWNSLASNLTKWQTSNILLPTITQWEMAPITLLNQKDTIIMEDSPDNELDLQFGSWSKFLKSPVPILAKRTRTKFIGRDLSGRVMYFQVGVWTLLMPNGKGSATILLLKKQWKRLFKFACLTQLCTLRR